MLRQLAEQFSSQIINFQLLMLVVNAFIQVLFAGAVARDAAAIQKVGQKPALVSPATWAFATLIGGVVVAAIYWFIHHSTFTKPLGVNANAR